MPTTSFSARSVAARAEALLDAGTLEVLPPEGDERPALLTVRGRLGGRRARGADRRPSRGGTVGHAEARQLSSSSPLAEDGAGRVVMGWDTGGVRVQEGPAALADASALGVRLTRLALIGMPRGDLVSGPRGCFGAPSVIAAAGHARRSRATRSGGSPARSYSKPARPRSRSRPRRDGGARRGGAPAMRAASRTTPRRRCGTRLSAGSPRRSRASAPPRHSRSPRGHRPPPRPARSAGATPPRRRARASADLLRLLVPRPVAPTEPSFRARSRARGMGRAGGRDARHHPRPGALAARDRRRGGARRPAGGAPPSRRGPRPAADRDLPLLPRPRQRSAPGARRLPRALAECLRGLIGARLAGHPLVCVLGGGAYGAAYLSIAAPSHRILAIQGTTVAPMAPRVLATFRRLRALHDAAQTADDLAPRARDPHRRERRPPAARAGRGAAGGARRGGGGGASRASLSARLTRPRCTGGPGPITPGSHGHCRQGRPRHRGRAHGACGGGDTGPSRLRRRADLSVVGGGGRSRGAGGARDGVRAEVIRADVTDEAQIVSAVHTVEERLGRLDIVVGCGHAKLAPRRAGR